MPRIRTVKPEFFQHYELYKAEEESGLPLRVAFSGLWTQSDREGRFKWRPEQLKLGCLPYDNVDFSRVLHALTTRGFIVKYAVGDAWFGVIPSFRMHQVINNRESESKLPAPEQGHIEQPSNGGGLEHDSDYEIDKNPRVDHACPTRLKHAQGEGKGREGKGKEGERVSSEDDAPALEEHDEQKTVNKKTDTVPYQKIVDLFLTRLPELPAIKKLSVARQRKIKNIWKSDPKFQSVEFWGGYFDHIRHSDFLMGRSKDFQASFDFLIDGAKFLKIIEGNYHGTKGQPS